MAATLYFFHDPMCSWCWGFRPVSDQLFDALPADINLQKIVGGLAPDADVPMPAALQQKLQATWQRIHALLGTEFNADFWTKCQPRRSTYPACRAVLAADRQGRYDAMVNAIQHAYYLRAMNPSDTETLEILASELHLDTAAFARDLRSEGVEKRLQQEIAFYRQCSSDGFPSFVLSVHGRQSAISLDYQDYRPMLAEINALLSSASACNAAADQEPNR